MFLIGNTTGRANSPAAHPAKMIRRLLKINEIGGAFGATSPNPATVNGDFLPPHRQTVVKMQHT